ncbi:MAG: formylglycine-generating enzyme family protein [Treponema sp.]|jgi:formylglycine-generating enzyme required for sulfatase activity|nr:formylglycine-generating enzyme family protein [Treponema sp.]
MSAKKIAVLVCALTTVFAAALDSSLYPRMIAAAGGTFLMGSSEGAFRQTERIHEVSLKSFFISETEITQELYQAVMNQNPALFKGAEYPVENVSWFDAVKFCNALSEQLGFAPAYTIDGDTVSWDRGSRGFRLPTEAEWEYAARGGQNGFLGELTRAGYAGSLTVNYTGNLTIGDAAWYAANSGRRTQPVRKKFPNELGLYDMSGNVWEWCWDWFGDYPSDSVYDPEGPPSGRNRVFRGGAFVNPVNQLRVSFRVGNPPSSKANSVGFRIAQNW